MKFTLFFTTLLFTTLIFSQSKGTLSGVITDKEANNMPLPFANVVLKGTSIAVTSNETGAYSISAPPGNYMVQFSFIGYENIEKSIVISAGETSTLNCTLGSGNYTLKDVVVKSTTKNREKESALLLEQKKAVEIKQSIGAQEMSRKGVSNVEEGLTKITGISKVESRGLFVRGLEERYNNLLINDLQTPSNSPFKKIIPLDLFPTNIVGVLSVYKTFNPNLAGDFAGATINVETTEAQSAQTKLGVGFGYVLDNNGSDFLISESANNDQGFLGIQKSKRTLSDSYGKISNYTLKSNEYLESYKNSTWNVDKVSAPINNSINFSHSEKFKFDKNRSFSYILSLNWDNEYQIRKGVDRTFIEGAGEYYNDFVTTSYKYLTNFSGLLGFKYKSNRLQVATNSFYLRSTENLIQDQFGISATQKSIPNRLIRSNQFEQSNYFNNQLSSNYKLTEDGKHSLRGGLSYVKTLFELPDRKFLVGLLNNDDYTNSYGGNTLNRQNFSIKGNYYMSGLLEYNLKFGKEISNKTNSLSAGYNSFNNSLSSVYRLFASLPIAPGVQNITFINDINSQIITDASNGIIAEREESNAEYKQKLNQFVNAGYVNLFFNVSQQFEISGGLRIENSDRIIKYRKLALGDTPTDPYRKDQITKNYFLPSVNSKYKLNDKANIRFAASQTITRPVLMELLPVQIVNPDGTVILGNKDLLDTQNLNADLKYEFFSDKKDMFAIGLYGKSIQDPIERVYTASATLLTTYQNSKSANLYGVELETIYNLSNISTSLNNFSIGFNTSLMKTKVTIAETNKLENEANRELQGASNWIVNADLKYEFTLGKEIKNTATLVFGVKGKNIYSVGTAGLDHIYEMPFQKLDLIYSSKLTKNINAKLTIDNLFNPSQKFELGKNSKQTIVESSRIVEDFKRGIGFGLGIDYTF